MLLTSSRAGLTDLPPVPPVLPPRTSARHAPNPLQAPDPKALVDVLRQALDSGTRSTESILRAATDSARVLSGADGTALALRTNGAVVCRARSGMIAPELGSTINVDSGISGECLRTATIMVCDDASTDSRVDAEACASLGVRSIVVVPLRGPMGIAGILEAFSSRLQAFGPEQIDALRALAEVIETANAQAVASAVAPAPKRAALFSSAAVKEEARAAAFSDAYTPKRRYWIPALVVAGLLLISLVAWWSWNAPVAETSANDSAARPAAVKDESPARPALQVVPRKPDAGVARRQEERLREKGIVQNAAEISEDAPAASGSAGVQPVQIARGDTGALRSPAADAVSAPPSVVVKPSGLPAAVTTGLDSGPMPALGAPVSTGVTEAGLIRKVAPSYPSEAKMRRVAGSVVLDATVGTDGAIRRVNVVDGPGLLTSAAVEAVKQWRYSPTLLNGKPVEVQKRITIVFKLP